MWRLAGGSNANGGPPCDETVVAVSVRHGQPVVWPRKGQVWWCSSRLAWFGRFVRSGLSGQADDSRGHANRAHRTVALVQPQALIAIGVVVSVMAGVHHMQLVRRLDQRQSRVARIEQPRP